MSKIKQHFKKHKTIYIAGGSSIFFAGITYLIMRDVKTPDISRELLATADRELLVIRDNSKLNIKGANYGVLAQGANYGVLGENSILNNVSYFSSNRQGPPSWVIRCLETNEVFTSQAEAARALNILPSRISEQLNGVRNNASGYTFERICMAA